MSKLKIVGCLLVAVAAIVAANVITRVPVEPGPVIVRSWFIPMPDASAAAIPAAEPGSATPAPQPATRPAAGNDRVALARRFFDRPEFRQAFLTGLQRGADAYPDVPIEQKNRIIAEGARHADEFVDATAAAVADDLTSDEWRDAIVQMESPGRLSEARKDELDVKFLGLQESWQAKSRLIGLRTGRRIFGHHSVVAAD